MKAAAAEEDYEMAAELDKAMQEIQSLGSTDDQMPIRTNLFPVLNHHELQKMSRNTQLHMIFYSNASL